MVPGTGKWRVYRKEAERSRVAQRPTKPCGSCIFAGKHSVCQAYKLSGKKKVKAALWNRRNRALGRVALNRSQCPSRSSGPSMQWDKRASLHRSLNAQGPASDQMNHKVPVWQWRPAGCHSWVHICLAPSTSHSWDPNVQAVVLDSGNRC